MGANRALLLQDLLLADGINDVEHILPIPFPQGRVRLRRIAGYSPGGTEMNETPRDSKECERVVN